MTTRQRILALLRREPCTVSELANRLSVTRNAIIVPLRQLEAGGLVRGQVRNEARVGKPAMAYEAVPGREDEASSAYPAFAELLVDSLREQVGNDQLRALMDRVGKKMSARLGIDPGADFVTRLKIATDFVDGLGADTVVEHTDGSATVRSFSCPLGRAVRQEPCVCGVMAAFFADVTRARVGEQCSRGTRLRCSFVIEKEDQAKKTLVSSGHGR